MSTSRYEFKNKIIDVDVAINKLQMLDFKIRNSAMEIEVLNNEPGVYSARYAGEQKNAEDNMNLVLLKLAFETNRKAQFKTSIALNINNQQYIFEGVVKGEITLKKSGNQGFGYDPIFQPEGFSTTFAEMSLEQKSEISHRGIAMQKLIDFLKNK